MAKGNMFQGMARGKVGDVVFSRLNGEQVSRVRNRHPQNPRTNAQLYQRAIMATIMQAYSAGKEIFDHSFEGFAKGSGCQREFMKLNAKYLRGVVADEVDAATISDECKGRVVAPGVPSPVGFEGLVVSKGSYQQSLFSYVASDDNWAFQLPAALSGEKCNEYALRNGMLSGDYYTIVGFLQLDDAPLLFKVNGMTSTGAKQYTQSFFYVRLGVKSTFVESTDAVAAKIYNDIFYIDEVSPYINEAAIKAATLTEKLDYSVLLTYGDTAPSALFAMIRSRKDMDLRSEASLLPMMENNFTGITSFYALDAWTQGTQALGNSNLILEGGGF